MLPVRRGADFLQEEVERYWKAADNALAQSVIGQITQPGGAALADAHAAEFNAAEAYRTRCRKLARQRLGQLLLAIAVDPGNSQHLARRDAEFNATKPRIAA